ncbi:MAG: hypothetical protein LBV69_11840 [Bacteroidales bacterium]|jgi:RHS repeat-associated protein|nr:hypothetical protein [Bacteroidales bacterium]
MVASNFNIFFQIDDYQYCVTYCYDTSAMLDYDPVIGRVLSPDNYVQDATNAQSYNRYSYCLNNPLKYTDPSGEFIQYIIGAIIGGVNGYMTGKAAGYDKWALFGFTMAGAAIGAGTAGIGTAVSSSFGTIVGGMTAGGAGAASFRTLGDLANGVGGSDLIKNHFTSYGLGMVSGLAGGTTGGLFGGGGIGAFFGGAASNFTEQLLYYAVEKNGNSEAKFRVNLLSLGISAGLGCAMYYTELGYSYHKGNIKSTTGWTFRQFAEISKMTQRSIFWNKEAKAITNKAGGFNVSKLGEENSVKTTIADYLGATSDYHSHQEMGYFLEDGEGFSMVNPTTSLHYNSGSDQQTRMLLNQYPITKNLTMYLGTREGHIWYMNKNFGIGMVSNYNFSRVFVPYYYSIF